MGSISDLIKAALGWGMLLWSMGRLPAATYWLGKEVAWSQAHPLSLVQLNHALMSGGRHAGRR